MGGGSSGGEQGTGVLRAGRFGTPRGSAVPADRAATVPAGLHWPGTGGAVNGEETDFGWVDARQLLPKGRFPQGQPAGGGQS